MYCNPIHLVGQVLNSKPVLSTWDFCRFFDKEHFSFFVNFPVPKLTGEGVVARFYPLHDKEDLKKLGDEWYHALFKDQPISKFWLKQFIYCSSLCNYESFLRFLTVVLDWKKLIESRRPLLYADNICMQESFAIFVKFANISCTQIFPVLQYAVLHKNYWYFLSSFFVDKIQEYFGETVAMYFAFLGNYTMALIPPALIGILSVFYHNMYMQVRIGFGFYMYNV